MDEPADKISKYVGSVSLLLNIILAVVVGLINQNWHWELMLLFALCVSQLLAMRCFVPIIHFWECQSSLEPVALW